jgi:hypothetical protein
MLRERGLMDEERCTPEEKQSREDVLAKIARGRTAGFMAAGERRALTYSVAGDSAVEVKAVGDRAGGHPDADWSCL